MNAVFAAIISLCEKHPDVRLSFVHAVAEPGGPIVLCIALTIFIREERYGEAFDVTLIGPTEQVVRSVEEQIGLLAKRAANWGQGS